MRGTTQTRSGRREDIVLGLAVLAVGFVAACRDEGEGNGDEANCTSAKCDALEESSDSGGSESGTDSGTAPSELDMACWERKDDAFNANRLAFTDTALRWSCADVDSTPAGERGQEYCEYFSIVSLPPSPSYPDPQPLVLGRNLGADAADGQTPIPIDLDSEQVAALENAADSVVGACVFTSWNADIEAPCGDTCDATDVLGVPVEPEVFRMKFDPNTNEAALALIDDCTGLLPTEGDPADPEDPYHDPFFRACHLNADINETQHRKSDNVICAASVRLAECGCSVATGAPLAETLAPSSDLGFKLGGWSGPQALPPGCRYQELEVGVVDDSQTLVVCDLTGAEVLQNAAELKSYCRDRYADDVVVHIAVAADAVVCEPPEGGPYAEGCSAHPWVLAP